MLQIAYESFKLLIIFSFKISLVLVDVALIIPNIIGMIGMNISNGRLELSVNCGQYPIMFIITKLKVFLMP